MIIANVCPTFEKQLHLLMYLKTLEYADIQCNQIYVPRDALSKTTLITQDLLSPYTTKDHIEHQQQVLQLLKDNATSVQNQMKQQVDQHRSEKCFDVGDWVFLLLHLKQAIYEKEMLAILHALKKWRPYRMGRHFKDEDVEALFCAISIIQPDWINEARDEWKKDEEVWPLIQKLQKIPIQTILPELEEEGKIILEPGAVTETRTRQLRNRSISEYLIKWKNLPAEDSTWEDKNFIQKHQELLKR